jgi:hypothetical protein
MTGSERTPEHSAAAVAAGVAKKTGVLAIAAVVAAAAVQMTAWPGTGVLHVAAGVLFGAALGAVNFRWLAYAVERVYLRQGTTGLLANVAAAGINVLKLSAIFIVLFVVIKNRWVHLIGLVIGLTACFAAVLWQGYGLVAGLKERTDGER